MAGHLLLSNSFLFSEFCPPILEPNLKESRKLLPFYKKYLVKDENQATTLKRTETSIERLLEFERLFVVKMYYWQSAVLEQKT